MTKICMIGTGYVGLVSGVCLADFGNRVVCVDIDEDRIAALNAGDTPIYEPGLVDLVRRNHDSGRILFSTELGSAVRESDVVFIAVGTPPQPDGSTDLGFVLAAAADVARHLEGYTVIVQKSTTPVGTARRVERVVRENAPPGAEFDMVANPEFLREGSAIEDFMRPDRVVVGVESERARAIMKEVYRPLYLLETPIVDTTLETAEMIKYASNAYLATKISFINEIAAVCERVGANVDDVARGMGLDGRIGRKFLHAGIGYGGSCLPKDVSSLLHRAREAGYDARLVRAAHEINDELVDIAVAKLERATGGLAGKTVALLGLSFKPNTDDLREAPSLRLAEKLQSAGATLRAFDPIAMPRFRAASAVPVQFCRDAYHAVENSDAVVLVTEWNEFRELDLARMKHVMKGNVFLDCRNVYRTQRVRGAGFVYESFGRGEVRGDVEKKENR